MTPDELGVLISDALKKQVEALKETLKGSNHENDLLTREQAAKFLSINSSTLWSYTNSGKLTAHAIVQKTVIVYHPGRIKVSHPRRVKVNHLRRMKVNH